MISHVAHMATVPSPTMSTDQRASERVGKLIHDAFESLLQANTDLDRLQDLLGLGIDAEYLLAPHSQMTWKFLVPQEQKFRENWKKFISAVENAEPSVIRPQQVAVGASGPAPTPPAIAAQTAEETAAVTQTEVRNSFGFFGGLVLTHSRQNAPEHSHRSQNQSPAPSIPATPIPVALKGETGHSEYLPPSDSVDNPTEIEDSDDDEIVSRASVTTSKRKKTGVRVESHPALANS